MDSHTVQRAYLKDFVLPSSTSRRFSVFTKRDKTWRQGSPKSTTVRPDYYDFARRDGTIDDSIEAKLSQFVESPGIKSLRKLAVGENLQVSERYDIARYLGFTMTRTTKHRTLQEAGNTALSDPEFVKEFVRKSRDQLEAKYSKKRIDDYLEEVESRGSNLKLHDAWHLIALGSAEKYGAIISAMNWVVETSRSPYWFITSDHPAFTVRPAFPNLPHTVGLVRDDLGSELCFPLNPTAFLRASFCSIGNCRRRATKTRVRELNRRVAIHANDEIIAPEKTWDIESIVEDEAESSVLPIDPRWVLQD